MDLLLCIVSVTIEGIVHRITTEVTVLHHLALDLLRDKSLVVLQPIIRRFYCIVV